MCHPHQLIGVKNVELVLLVVLLIRKKSLESSSESSGCFRNNWYTPQKMFGHPFIESVLLTYLRIGYIFFYFFRYRNNVKLYLVLMFQINFLVPFIPAKLYLEIKIITVLFFGGRGMVFPFLLFLFYAP